MNNEIFLKKESKKPTKVEDRLSITKIDFIRHLVMIFGEALPRTGLALGQALVRSSFNAK